MQTTQPHISVVTPVYGCKTCLAELYLRLKQTLEQITLDFEIIMVNDASPDGAWETIVELAAREQRVKGINLSRNFGQHYAITAGLDYAAGEWVVVMDCDLQDQPEEIVKLYNKALEGYDYVQGQRIDRQDKKRRKILSKLFYIILSYFHDYKIDNTIANFGIYNNKVMEAIKLLPEKIRWFPSLVHWVGFSGISIPINHNVRKNGKSTYSLRKLFLTSIDVFILNTEKPMRIMAGIGFLLFMSSIVYSIIIIIKYVHGDITVLGYSSIIISILFCSGLIIFFIGILGLYISKILQQTQDRPLYIITNKTF